MSLFICCIHVLVSLTLFDFGIVVANMTNAKANLPAGANQAEDAKEEALGEAQEDSIKDSGNKDAGNPYDEAFVLCGVELQRSCQAIATQGFMKMRDWLTLSKEAIVEFVKALNKLKVMVGRKSYAICIPFSLIK
jgi:hypothetical protein